MYMKTGRSKGALALLLVCGFGLLTTSGASAEDRSVRVRTMPEYPAMGKQLRLSGIVRLKVKVNPDGSIRNIEPIGGSPVFIPAAVAAVEKWKFEAGPRETEEVIAVSFKSP